MTEFSFFRHNKQDLEFVQMTKQHKHVVHFLLTGCLSLVEEFVDLKDSGSSAVGDSSP